MMPILKMSKLTDPMVAYIGMLECNSVLLLHRHFPRALDALDGVRLGIHQKHVVGCGKVSI
jgi:hypothetical protein